MASNLVTTIDHLVVSCYFIQDGLNYVFEKLGVAPEQGGKHDKMGTHNQLIKLGESVYLEIIAVNPDAANPNRHRWFAMDELQPNSKPKLVTWVVSTNDIQYIAENSNLQYGKIESMRRNNYDWQITIPENGEMPMQGIAPAIIQWNGTLHPAQSLTNNNLFLDKIEGFHPKADEINKSLRDMNFKGAFIAKPIHQSETPYLTAFIKSSRGILTLQ